MIPRVLGVAGCAALPPRGANGQPSACTAPITTVGVVRARLPGRELEAWLMFTCAEHADGLLAARPLLERDRAELQQWAAEAHRWTLPVGHPDRPGPHGRPWIPPAPLAVGDAAAALLARAAGYSGAPPTDGGRGVGGERSEVPGEERGLVEGAGHGDL